MTPDDHRETSLSNLRTLIRNHESLYFYTERDLAEMAFAVGELARIAIHFNGPLPEIVDIVQRMNNEIANFPTSPGFRIRPISLPGLTTPGVEAPTPATAATPGPSSDATPAVRTESTEPRPDPKPTGAKIDPVEASTAKPSNNEFPPPPLPTEIDFEAIFAALINADKGKCARLVRFMADKDSASYQDILDGVHDGSERTWEGIKTLVTRTNNALIELEGPVKAPARRLKFKVGEMTVIKKIKPA